MRGMAGIGSRGRTGIGKWRETFDGRDDWN